MKVLSMIAVAVPSVLAIVAGNGGKHIIRGFERHGSAITLRHFWPVDAHPYGGWQEVYFAPTLTSSWTMVHRSFLESQEEESKSSFSLDVTSSPNGFFKIVGLPSDPDPWEIDSDDDGLVDGYEQEIGTDPYNADTDGDGLDDQDEESMGTNPCKFDTDDDGVDDATERMLGMNPTQKDTDGDGLEDGMEFDIGTDPTAVDSDCDEMPDGWERDHGFDPMNCDDGWEDADGDGITNCEEWYQGTDPNVPNVDDDGDNDGDGISNAEEMRLGTDPNSCDTDNDLINDDVELAYGLNPKDHSDGDGDLDGDGLSNVREFAIGTNPIKADTDGDGATDGWELANGFDPMNEYDCLIDMDGDGLTVAEESKYGTDPRNADADGDGLLDKEEIEIGSCPTNAYSFSSVYNDRIMYHSDRQEPFSNPEGSSYNHWQHTFYSGSAMGEVRLPVSSETNAVLSVSVIGSGYGEIKIGDKVVSVLGNGSGSSHNELLVSLPRGQQLTFSQQLPTTLTASFASTDFAIGQMPVATVMAQTSASSRRQSLGAVTGWIAFPNVEATLPCIHDLCLKRKDVSLEPGGGMSGITCTWHGSADVAVESTSDLSATITANFPVKETRSLSYTISHDQALFGTKTYTQTVRFCPCEEEEEEEEEEDDEESGESSGAEWQWRSECWCLGTYCMSESCDCPCHRKKRDYAEALAEEGAADEEELMQGHCPIHKMPPEDCAEFHKESYAEASVLPEHPGLLRMHGEKAGKEFVLAVPETSVKCCPCPEHTGRRATLTVTSPKVRVFGPPDQLFVEANDDCEIRLEGVSPSEEVGDAKIAFCRNGKLGPEYALTVMGLDLETDTSCFEPDMDERVVTFVTDVALSEGDVHVELKCGKNGHFQLWYDSYATTDRQLLVDSKTRPTFDIDIRTWRKMLEACTSGRNSDLTLVKVSPGTVTLKFGFALESDGAAIRDEVEATFESRQAYLVFDYDRNGVIDETDRFAAKREKTFSFWVNDDGDSGDAVADGDYLSDLPGSGGNGSDEQVNGLRDLLDFTPVAIDLSDAFPEGENEISRNRIQWRLRSNCVRAVWTDLEPKNAGAYLSESRSAGFGSGTGEAPDVAYSSPLSDGVSLADFMCERLRENDGTAVFLIEGIRPGTELVLEGWYDDGSGERKLYETHAPLAITGVEDMYRHVSIRAAADNPNCAVTIPADPPNAPETKASAGDVFFVHGFNVEPDAARVWFSEMFKRLWQSGSNARFTGIEWAGDYHVLSEAFNAVHYQRDVYQALMSSAALIRAIEKSSGSKRTLLAHSLGNMVASEALKNGLHVDSYVMLNAAVPSEAYDCSRHNASAAISAKYVPDDWRDYPVRSWASDWYTWFPDDDRGELGWPGRYEAIDADKTLAYYTSEDEVFEESDTAPSLLTNVFHWPTLSLTWPFVDLSGVMTLDSFAWQKSEVCKGVELIAGSYSGGWGFHTWSESVAGTDGTITKRYSPAEAEQMVADGTITENPVFDRGQSAMFSPTIDRSDKYHVLAYNIPAVSSAAGHDSVGKNGGGDARNMLNGARGNVTWRHSGLKNLSYWHVRGLFDTIVSETGVR